MMLLTGAMLEGPEPASLVPYIGQVCCVCVCV